MNPLVSVIVPTRNSASNLERCLFSLKRQDYPNAEIIVVDNKSSDATKEIALRYASAVLDAGPERSAQRNFGAEKSAGDFLLFIDSDMELPPDIISRCVAAMADTGLSAVIIPEESAGEGFWSKCKRLEKSFYENNDLLEAPRFFRRSLFKLAGGYDAAMVSGEDYDLGCRIASIAGKNAGRIDSRIIHHEGKPKLSSLMKKKFYYGRKIHTYKNKSANAHSFVRQSSLLGRYRLFFSDRKRLLAEPAIGVGLLFMKTAEFIAGGFGYIIGFVFP